MPPAARIVDPTTHGAPLSPGPGSMNVLIGGLPAWRTLIDQHACPAVSISGADGVGMVMKGSLTVLINTQMACRMGDIVVEIPGLAMGPANPILMGCPTVLIGEMGPPAPPGLGGESLSSAMCAPHKVPMPGAVSSPAGGGGAEGAGPQAAALQEAADEGTPLVEKCPYAHDA
jgi:uncharacterized Zn-binding protein involved in type VI secretion